MPNRPIKPVDPMKIEIIDKHTIAVNSVRGTDSPEIIIRLDETDDSLHVTIFGKLLDSIHDSDHVKLKF